MKRLRKLLANTFLSSALLILLGVLFIIFHDKINNALKLILFSGLLIMGGGHLLFYFRENKTSDEAAKDLVNGLSFLLLAVFVYFQWGIITGLVQYIFALLICFSGIRKIHSSISLFSLKSELWYLMLAAAIINLVFGIVLLFVNVQGILFQLLGGGFIFSAVTDLVSSLWISVCVRRGVQEKEKKAQAPKKEKSSKQKELPSKEATDESEPEEDSDDLEVFFESRD